MKKYLSLMAGLVALMLSLTACESPESRVRNVAETFLHAYYAGDYGAAADFCTPACAERVRYAGPDILVDLPDEAQAKIKEALSRTSFEIVSVEVDEDAASALVHYALSVPDVEKPVPMTLKLQLEGRTALVDGIQ